MECKNKGKSYSNIYCQIFTVSKSEGCTKERRLLNIPKGRTHLYNEITRGISRHLWKFFNKFTKCRSGICIYCPTFDHQHVDIDCTDCRLKQSLTYNKPVSKWILYDAISNRGLRTYPRVGWPFPNGVSEIKIKSTFNYIPFSSSVWTSLAGTFS